MMKSALSLCLLAALPCVAQEAADVSTFPKATAEGWGKVVFPVPPGYEVSVFKGDNHFVFSLAKPKQKPALEIYNGFEPPAAEEGEKCYAGIAGKRRRGVVVPQEDGSVSHEFLLPDGPAGSAYLVTLPASPDSTVMMAVMNALQFDTTPTGNSAKEADEAPSADTPATPRTFRGKGSFTLAVPDDLRVTETKDGDALFVHFLSPKGKRVMSIYNGYAPAVQTGGKPCTAVIAGKETEGNKLSGAEDPAAAILSPGPGAIPGDGEEYVIPGGAEGALYHITIFDTPRRAQVLGMVAGMALSGGSPLPESAQQQITALRENAEACVRNANLILSKVKDRASADAAVAELTPLADAMQKNDKAAAALQSRYGRALHGYLHAPDKSDKELSPTTKSRRSEPENEIQRVHEADCYGSEALEALLMRFLGIDND